MNNLEKTFEIIESIGPTFVVSAFWHLLGVYRQEGTADFFLCWISERADAETPFNRMYPDLYAALFRQGYDRYNKAV